MDDNELVRMRLQKLERLKSSGNDPFKSRYGRTHLLKDMIKKHKDIRPGEKTEDKVKVAGRILARREHGKASFAVLKDSSGRLQLYLTVDSLGEDRYKSFLDLDIGDLVGVEGIIFKTRRGELSIQVDDFVLLTKSLRPLPEKWHGLKSVETRYRQRYVDLIMNPEVKETFLLRNKVVQAIRKFLDQREFIEVETPMLQQIPGGAMARPFKTYHQALGTDLYMRIAPELYLKRLVVGGMEKIYELNRNFRNEGMSNRHNPEFTMLEVYQAYADYNDMMKLTEELIKYVAVGTIEKDSFTYQGEELDFSKDINKLTMLEAVKVHAGLDLSFDQDLKELKKIAKDSGVEVEKGASKGKIITEIFEKLVEPKLAQPTFVLDYPREMTPLARAHPKNPNLVERFELIVAGREIANAFSELTDPLEQRKRFEEQVALRAKGDEEAQVMDEDFLRALEYGMPPAGGLGIGIDRLAMLFADVPTIRDVLLFPQMRPEDRP